MKHKKDTHLDEIKKTISLIKRHLVAIIQTILRNNINKKDHSSKILNAKEGLVNHGKQHCFCREAQWTNYLDIEFRTQKFSNNTARHLNAKFKPFSTIVYLFNVQGGLELSPCFFWWSERQLRLAVDQPKFCF